MMSAQSESLTTFLRDRRQRVAPETHGLPNRRRLQRSNGLRRDDVAELLGVSPLWYAVFERGRSQRRFSKIFLERLQDVLLLDSADRECFSKIVIAGGHAAAEFEAQWYSERWRQLSATVSALAESLASNTADQPVKVTHASLTNLLEVFGATSLA